MITAIIPAVDEPDIDATIRSLLAQNPSPSRIIVAWNNASSSVTADAVARVQDSRVELHDLGSVSGRKAGAINKVLPEVDTELVLVMDADTVMGPDFLQTAVKTLENKEIAAVGGVFHGVKPQGFLQWCQYLEYERFSREVERTRRVMVLTGTGSVLRMSALRAVRQGRAEGLLSGEDFYDATAITEDNEMSLALKSCKYLLASPKECSTTTELMGTWKDLQKQRIRWYRGALDNLRTYGYTNTTRRYWFQQVMLLLSVLTFSSYVFISAVSLSMGWFSISPIWLLVGAVFLLERVITVWHTGWRGRLLAALLIPELIYSGTLQVAFLRGILAHVKGSVPEWHQAIGVR